MSVFINFVGSKMLFARWSSFYFLAIHIIMLALQSLNYFSYVKTHFA